MLGKGAFERIIIRVIVVICITLIVAFICFIIQLIKKFAEQRKSEQDNLDKERKEGKPHERVSVQTQKKPERLPGNRLGWILAGIFGAFVVIVLVKVIALPSPTPPTWATIRPGMLPLQKPAEPLTTILPAGPYAEGDAGDDYQRALQLYQENLDALEDVLEHYDAVGKNEYSLTADELGLLNRVGGAIRAGTARKQMTYYFRLTPRKMEIPYKPREAEQFQDLINVPLMLSVHHAARGEAGYPEAEKCLFDILVLGHHMIQERARLGIVQHGIGLQKEACKRLTKFYGKRERPDRVKAVEDYLKGLETISGTYADLYATIWPGRAFEPHPGDIFNLVANHADRAVRVEAILQLGVVKLTCTSRGDRKRVRALINKKLTSPDPIEQAAARCADALDHDGLNRLAGER